MIPGYAPDVQALVNMRDADAADELGAMCAGARLNSRWRSECLVLVAAEKQHVCRCGFWL